ncbi:MAG: four helix bundle protein [Roseiflexaceae bacterium]|nr:four helix bundle protein [Roseiflexaceae bacterium]
MPRIERFEDLEAWQQARKLANTVYDLSDFGVFARDFALRDQMRRAAVSIMSNIAEGFERRTLRIYIEHLEELKHRVAKSVHNCIWHMIASTCQVKSSNRLLPWQKAPVD